MKNCAVIYYKRCSLVLFSSLLMIGCSEPQDDLMDVIEGQVVLPSKSEGNLDNYTRFYAYQSNGNIQVLYTTIISSEGDYRLFSNEIEDYCSDRKDRYPNCLLDYKKIFSAKAGKRYWLEDYNNLPIPDDGGCAVIQFSFLKDGSVITQPQCNEGGID